MVWAWVCFFLQSFNSKSLETLLTAHRTAILYQTAHYSLHSRHHMGCTNRTNIQTKISPSWLGKGRMLLPSSLCCSQESHTVLSQQKSHPASGFRGVNDVSTQCFLETVVFASSLTCLHCSRWEVGEKQMKSNVLSKQNTATDLQYAYKTYGIPKATSPAFTLHPLCSD